MGLIVLGLQGNVYFTTSARTGWATAADSRGFYNGTGPQSLSVLSAVRNVVIDDKDAEADGTTRASGGFKLSINSLTAWELQFEIPWQPGDAGFQALQYAKRTRNTVGVVALDGTIATSGSQGPWADWCVFDFPRDEPEAKEMLSKVVLRPAPSAVGPQWVQVN